MKIRIKYKKGSGVMKKALAGILIVSLICCTGCSTIKQTTEKPNSRFIGNRYTNMGRAL